MGDGNECGTAFLREAADIVRRAADDAGARQADRPKVHVIVRKRDVAPEEAIAQEARRGYDLLVVGIANVADPSGGFHADLSRLLGKFQGSLAVVVTRGTFEDDPGAKIERVLTPVTGNENSRRGAEVAVTLAGSAHARISALSVTSPEERRHHQFRRETKAVAEEIRRIAKQLNTKVRMIIRADRVTEDAILHTIERGKIDLVVMGASRRPGDALSFGSVANALIRKAPCSLVIVAPQMRGATRSATTGPDVAAAG